MGKNEHAKGVLGEFQDVHANPSEKLLAVVFFITGTKLGCTVVEGAVRPPYINT